MTATEPSKKSYSLFYILLLGAAAATLLLCCLLNPLFLSLKSDIVLQELFVTAVLYYFDSVLEELIFATLIALVAAGEYLFRGNKSRYITTKLLIFSVVLLKYICNFFATAIEAGFEGFTATDFESLGLSLLFDLLILGGAFLASFLAVRRHFEKAKTLEKAYRIAGKGEFDEKAEFYPYRRFLAPKTPVLAGVFWGSLGTLLLKILSSLYYDLFFWGFPETGEDAIQMVENYAIILLLAVVSYTFAFFMSSFLLKEKNKKTAE